MAMVIADSISTGNAFDPENSAELSRSLHQLAQPLTVLQGCLELILMGAHTVDEYKRSIQQALDESRRVSAGFDHIRELLRNSQPANSAMSPVAPPISDIQEIRSAHV
jgi:signal transduction histidine kinase